MFSDMKVDFKRIKANKNNIKNTVDNLVYHLVELSFGCGFS